MSSWVRCWADCWRRSKARRSSWCKYSLSCKAGTGDLVRLQILQGGLGDAIDGGGVRSGELVIMFKGAALAEDVVAEINLLLLPGFLLRGALIDLVEFRALSGELRVGGKLIADDDGFEEEV
jgi:hypothetical protein